MLLSIIIWGAWEQQQAAQQLVNILGSVEAANAYLAEMQDQEEQPPSQEEEGLTLEHLLAYVAQALRGNTGLGQQMWQLTQQMAADDSLPTEFRELGRVLQRLLSGEPQPDLSRLPPELARAVRERCMEG